MITNIRQVLPGDLNYLLDIDLKCFEDALSLDQWRAYCNDSEYRILVGTRSGMPIGYVLWQDNIVERIAVKPVYRQQGVGSRLLRAVENILVQQGQELVGMRVSESLCNPQKSIDVSRWLHHHGFKASSMIKDASVFCGQSEDLIVFTKELAETITHG